MLILECCTTILVRTTISHQKNDLGLGGRVLLCKSFNTFCFRTGVTWICRVPSLWLCPLSLCTQNNLITSYRLTRMLVWCFLCILGFNLVNKVLLEDPEPVALISIVAFRCLCSQQSGFWIYLTSHLYSATSSTLFVNFGHLFLTMLVIPSKKQFFLSGIYKQ